MASLIALAMSNRQIAEQLVLSERTAEPHVRSIVAKLGYSIGTEIATSEPVILPWIPGRCPSSSTMMPATNPR